MTAMPSWPELHRLGMTAKQAAEARGTNIATPYAWAKRHGLVWPAPEAKSDACPVVIRGKHYPSHARAAADPGVCPTVIGHHLDRYGHADFVGQGQKGRKTGRTPSNAQQVIVGGKRYPSMTSAARDLGVSVSSVSSWFKGRCKSPAEAMVRAAIRRNMA